MLYTSSSPQLARRCRSRGSARLIAVALVATVGLGVTAGGLWLLAPKPLTPDTARSLYATTDASLPTTSGLTAADIFGGINVAGDRWSRIVIRDSKSAAGNASTLADDAGSRGVAGPPDHFVIGNGNGAANGELQITTRWVQQLPASYPGYAGETGVISVVLIGDLGRTPPTEQQIIRLNELLRILNEQLGVGADVSPDLVDRLPRR